MTEILIKTYEETIKRLQRRNHILEEENRRLELANIRKYSELNSLKKDLKELEEITYKFTVDNLKLNNYINRM